VNLVKEPIVHSGIHTLELKISDRQGGSAVNELTVTVCDCTTTPGCRGRQLSTVTVSFSAIVTLLIALLVLLSKSLTPVLWVRVYVMFYTYQSTHREMFTNAG